jgi:LDH2 family malate/lactate/ureidoglycolate dehydrogenase
MDPAAFGGAASFVRQTSFIAAACRSNPPGPGMEAIRLPGEQGLARKRQAPTDGPRLYPGIMAALEPWAEILGVELPPPRGAGTGRPACATLEPPCALR